jgi:hypothetical protein
MSIGNTIPAIEGIKDPQVVRVLTPMKTIIDDLIGHTQNRPQIKKLGPDPELSGVIHKINEIIDRLQL